MEIKISKSAHVCGVCARGFVHEEEYRSIVNIVDGEFVRADYCRACWEEEFGSSAYSVWSPKYYDPKVAQQQPAEVFSPLRELFYASVASEDRRELSKAYLAAQLLRRQKVFRMLKEADETDGEVKVLLYDDRIGNRSVEVRDPSFTYGELDEARVLLMEHLRELEAPEPEEEDTESDVEDDQKE